MATSQNLTTLILRLVVQTDQMSRDLKRVQGEVSGWEQKTKGAAANVAKYFAGAFSVLAAISFLRNATKAAVDFGDAIAEVSTLLPSDTDMRPITEGAKTLAVQFGSNPREQAKAYYQIISAGAEDAASATQILTAANELAVGGVTDVFTAADGLTSVLNAYGISAEKATDVTDAMFVAMRAGKTTIPELSQNIGQVATVAAQTGVALDDLLAATAALTKGGVNTAQAMTQIRSVLVAVLKQEDSAVKFAKSLGIEFSVSAIKAKGFAGFIKDVADKTGGSAESLANLFGRVEGLSGVLALGGEAADDYAAILEQMSRKAGSTAEAFRKMSEQAGFKLNQLRAAFNVLAIDVGSKLLTVIVPAAEAIVEHMDGIVKVTALLATFIGTKLVAAIGIRLVGAIAASILQMRLAYIESIRYQAALARMSLLNGAAATTSLGLAGALTAVRTAMTGLFVGLGGWVGIVTTAIGLLASLWVAFGDDAEDAGIKATDALAKQKRELDKQILANREIKKTTEERIKATDEELAALKRQNDELERQKQVAGESTDEMEALAASLGDTTGLSTQRSIGDQIYENKNRTTELLEEREKLTGAKVLDGEKTFQDTLRETIPILEEQNEKLRERLRLLEEAQPAESFEAVGISLGDVSAVVEDPDAIKKQIDINDKLIVGYREKLLNDAEDARDKIIKAQFDEAQKAKGAPAVGLTPPEVLEAQLKANQKILEIQNAEQIAILEDSYKRGLLDTQEYYARRRALVTAGIRAEIAALKKEQTTKSTTDVRREEIRAEIVQKEILLRRENAKSVEDEIAAVKKFNEAVTEGETQAVLAGVKEELTLVEDQYKRGLLTVQEYYDEKRRLSNEATQAEILNLIQQLGYTQDVIEQQKILNDIAAKRAAQKVATIVDADAERDASEKVIDVAREINERYLELQAERSTNVLQELDSRSQLEQVKLADRFDREIKRVEEHKDYLIELDGVYYEKSAALEMLADQKALALKKLTADQAKAVVDAKLELTSMAFNHWANAMGAMFQATGGKIKAFFFAQKAFAIAQATIDAYVAFNKTLASVPYPWNIAAAAAVLVQALAQVANIVKQKPAGYKEGGPIRGGSGTKDDVPILATAGEYMIKRQAVDYYGVRAVEAINRMILPKSVFEKIGPLKISSPEVHFQGGGAVAVPESRDRATGTDGRLTQLLLDGRVIGEWFMEEVAFGRIKLVPR